MYTFVNKNYLIPIVFQQLCKDDALNKLYHETVNRTKEYNEFIYVINDNENPIEIFYSDGINLYHKNNLKSCEGNIIAKYDKINFLSRSYLSNNFKITYNEDENYKLKNMNLTIDNKFLNNNVILTETNTNTDTNTDTNTHKEKEYINIKYIDDNKKVSFKVLNECNNLELDKDVDSDKNNNDEYNKKREEIIKLIEQVNDMYQKEMSNIRRLELNLKTFETKLNKLNKKKREENINNIIKTQSEYQTWKKIKYIMEDETDVLKPINELELSNKSTPILFLSKYEYINKIQENDGISNLLEKINLIDLNKLYSDDTLPNDSIVQFSEKYVKLSKELHYHFDHEWDYLENEMNANSTNKLTNK